MSGFSSISFAVSSTERSPVCPDVPTVIELGMPDMVSAVFFGVVAVAQTEVECVDSHYQWSNATNVWHNAQIRTMIYQVTFAAVIVSSLPRPKASTASLSE